MHYVRRAASGLVARVDQILARIENHDALIDSALRDVQTATARAKVHLQRVRRDGEQLRADLQAAERQQARWKRRALSFRENDEARALECLRRSKQAGAQAEFLRTRLDQHEQTERNLGAEVEQLEQKLSELRERQHLMRTRQSCSEAAAAADEAGQGSAREIEEAFERWEIRLTEAEMTRSTATTDPLERELDTAEEHEALQAELAELGGDEEAGEQGGDDVDN